MQCEQNGKPNSKRALSGRIENNEEEEEEEGMEDKEKEKEEEEEKEDWHGTGKRNIQTGYSRNGNE